MSTTIKISNFTITPIVNGLLLQVNVENSPKIPEFKHPISGSFILGSLVTNSVNVTGKIYQVKFEDLPKGIYSNFYCRLKNATDVGSDISKKISVEVSSVLAPIVIPATSLTRTKFSTKLGINGFPWDFVANDSTTPDTAKLTLLNSFGGFRLYADWTRVENEEGKISFDYTNGSWNIDRIVKAAKDQNMPVLLCFQKAPQWLQNKNNRPSDQYDDEVIPAPYGLDLLDPNTYSYSARLMYYAAARYGSNKDVNISTLPLTLIGYPWPNWTSPDAPFRQQKVGLGLVDCLEPSNEVDRWWKGSKSQMTPNQIAAYMSKNYDNHMQSGAFGAKNADPSILVSIPGFADSTTSGIKAMIEWCKINRGYRKDGSINICWDVMNYHAYPFSVGTQYSGSGKAISPEASNLGKYAREHKALADQYGYQIWLTETGYDSNESSPLQPLKISNKSVEETRADWALRSALLHDRIGIHRVYHYETHDQNFGGQFGTSGFLNDSNRKAQGDYFYQVKQLLGEYSYMETSNESPVVSKYVKDKSTIYVVYMPTQAGLTSSITIPGSSALVSIPTIGSDSMTTSTLNGTLTITATETPTFIKILS